MNVIDSQFDVLLDVTLEVTAEVGSTTMPIASILALGAGSIVQFANPINAPIALLANGRPIARCEIVAVDDRFALRITELAAQT